jgi:hypothetical protein
VVLHVTDISHQNGAAVVTRRRLESIGFNVDDKPMDWSTNLTMRARKEPPSKGGWNIMHSWIDAVDVMNPVVNPPLSGAGPDAWFGWPDIPQIEKLVTARDRSDEAQAGHGRDPEGCPRRGGVRPVGRVVDADGPSKERSRRHQIHCATFLEREDRVGPITRHSPKSFANLHGQHPGRDTGRRRNDDPKVQPIRSQTLIWTRVS